MATTVLLFPELREKAAICYAKESLEKAVQVIESFGLPGGLLPLEDVSEAGWVEETGFVWIATNKKQEHHFKQADRICYYGGLVTCYVEKNKLKKITGIKAKDILLPVQVNEIYVDEAKPPKIHFKAFAGLTQSFPVEYFARGA